LSKICFVIFAPSWRPRHEYAGKLETCATIGTSKLTKG